VSDIVERLRNDQGIGIDLTLCREAADRIERLREALLLSMQTVEAQDALKDELKDEIERLRAALNKLIRFAQSLSEQASDMTCQYEAEEIYLHGVPQLLQEASGVIEEARAALSPAPATDVQLPKGWLADEFARVDADVAQWSPGMRDSFKEATGIAIPKARATLSKHKEQK
jgi:hypothetical protein